MKTMKTQVKSPDEIEKMRRSGRILAEILEYLRTSVQIGMTTAQIDAIAAEQLRRHQVDSAFLFYNGFPATICISINNEIVHGIPGERVVQAGDLVGLDFGVIYEGMITDSAITIYMGEGEEPHGQVKNLLDYTQRALSVGIDVLKDGVRVGDIGAAIDAELRRGGLKVIDSLGGHGVGHKLHEDPIIPNFGTPGTGQTLKAGMTIALEPIASIGTHKAYIADDNWTFMTADDSLSAQFEHTILVTQDGAEILTQL